MHWMNIYQIHNKMNNNFKMCDYERPANYSGENL